MFFGSLYQKLSQTELLNGCCLEGIQPLEHSFSKGEYITDEIGGQTMVGFIIEGIVDVYSLSEDGTEVKLSELLVGESFGISNILVQQELATRLECRTATTVIFIRKDDFIQLMQKNPTLGIRYLTLCNKKIQFLIKRINLLTMQSCRAKLIAYLLENKEPSIALPSSKETLAKMLGISRAALFRELAYLQNNGLIKTTADAIIVLNAEALKQLLWRQ